MRADGAPTHRRRREDRVAHAARPRRRRPDRRRPPFRFSAHVRVWFSDTDAQGVVYYGRYLPYFDYARLEYHRHLGLTAMWRGAASSSCGR